MEQYREGEKKWWHPDSFLESLYAHASTDRNAKEQEETKEEKKTRLKSQLWNCLGTFGSPSDGLNPVILEREEDGDIIRERVEYSTVDGLRVPAYVLIPKSIQPGEKRSAVIAWHGHGYGSREVVGLTREGEKDDRPLSGHKHYGWQLAKKGCVVLAPDLIGLGDRVLESDLQRDPKSSSCVSLSTALLMYGKSLPGLRVHEAIVAMDYLSARDEVDAERVGNIGFSGGGTVASLSAALDERIKASVICGYSNTYKGSIMARRHCLDNYIPGVLQVAEMPELLGLIAPRALFIESGTNDKLFPERYVKQAAEEVQQVFRQWDASDSFSYHIFEGGHEVSGEKSFDWLVNQLT